MFRRTCCKKATLINVFIWALLIFGVKRLERTLLKIQKGFKSRPGLMGGHNGDRGTGGLMLRDSANNAISPVTAGAKSGHFRRIQ